MIRKYRFRLSTGYVGGTITEEIEIDVADDDSEDAIVDYMDKMLNDWVANTAEPSWEDITEED